MKIDQSTWGDDYSISSDDEIIEALPSAIVEAGKAIDNTSDTSSDDRNELEVIYNNHRRKPSFVEKTLKQFSTRIDILPEKLKGTFTIETNTPPSGLSYIENKILYGLAVITLVIIVLIIVI
jgi:hypothetical protein